MLGPPTAISGKVHQRCAASLNAARMILAGYDHNIDEVFSHCLTISIRSSNIIVNHQSFSTSFMLCFKLMLHKLVNTICLQSC